MTRLPNWEIAKLQMEYDKEQAQLKRQREDERYWTELFHQYAGMAMQGILARYGVEPLPDDASNDAREYAYALVEKMKKERK